MMQKKKVAIALGSNLGDRFAMLQSAVKHLSEDLLENVHASSVYETAPWGIAEQPSFYNAVVVGETEWKPPAIVNFLKTLETELGRQKRVRNGPREIDLDLIAYAEETFEGDGVTVPHPGMTERDFVLIPLVEVWPEWVHPTLKLSASKLLHNVLSENQTTPTVVGKF